MDNLSWGNPVAHRVRVHFNTASAVIYEGMPVCYNYDTTVNWAGGSVSDGAVTASTTLTAGSPATAAAKYLEVEEPSANNIQWFAGVVARGGWCGKTTSATAGVGQLLDIYVPNGAIVPVRTDSNCLIGQTILAITTGSQELGVPLATDSRAVAISEETYNRGTAGLVLAKLDPSLFMYQDHAGTALSVDDADTTTSVMVNHSNIKFLGSATCDRPLYMIGELAGGGAGLNGMFKFRTYVSSTMTNCVQVVCANLHLKDDGVLKAVGGGEYDSCFYATIETEETSSLAVLTTLSVCAYQAAYYLDESETTPAHAYILGVPSGFAAGTYQWDGLLIAQSAGAIGAAASPSGPAFGAGDIMIPCRIGDTTYYLPALVDSGSD